MTHKPFNYEEAKKDLSKVAMMKGWEIVEMHLFSTPRPYPLHVLVKDERGMIFDANYTLEGKAAGGSAWDLYLLASPKTIDWSKLPRDTLVETTEGLRYFQCSSEDDPSCVFVYNHGATSQTAKGWWEVSKAKLIEQKEFKVWFGGECPVPEGVVVGAVNRSGVYFKQNSQDIRWMPSKIDQKYDIIAYRIIGVAEGYTPYFEGREF